MIRLFDPRLILVLLAVYLATLVQVGIFGTWPLFGGQPHLIALGAALLLLIDEPKFGLWWVTVGGLLLDGVLPLPLGLGTLSLLVGYGLLYYLRRYIVHGRSWLIGPVMAGALVVLAEIPLVLSSGGWTQVGLDLIATLVVVVPISMVLVSRRRDTDRGLRLSW